MNEQYFISTDKTKLDVDVIHTFLSNESYWAKGRSEKTIKESINNSLCFGVYDKNNNMIGFARVVSDFAVFAWILDLFILSEHRCKGLSKKLMEHIMDNPKLQNLQRWGLCTDDAHGLYSKYGFEKIRKPEIFMEIKNKPN